MFTFASKSFGRVALVSAVAALGLCEAAPAAPANPATENLAAWKTPKYNCFNYAQASKANEFEQIAGLPIVFDQNKPAFTGTDLATAIAANYAFTNLGAPAMPPATPDNKSLVALVADETKGFIQREYNRYVLDPITGVPVIRPDGTFVTTKVIQKIPKADFHWYRFNANGLWSDKPGRTDAKVFKNGAANVTNPKTADRGAYTTFVNYYAVPPGAAGRPGEAITSTFDRPGTGARGEVIQHSGLDDPHFDIENIPGLLNALPSGVPISDPNWEPFYMNSAPEDRFGGFALIPDLSSRSSIGAEFVRVYQGVVAMHRPDGATVDYFLDDNNLSGFLAGSVPEPGSAAALMLAAPALLARRARRLARRPATT